MLHCPARPTRTQEGESVIETLVREAMEYQVSFKIREGLPPAAACFVRAPLTTLVQC